MTDASKIASAADSLLPDARPITEADALRARIKAAVAVLKGGVVVAAGEPEEVSGRIYQRAVTATIAILDGGK
jgi:hypothetical protein